VLRIQTLAAVSISDTAYEFRAVSPTSSIDGLADCNASSGGSYQLSDGSATLVFGPFEESVCEGQSEQNWIDQNTAIEDLLIAPQNSQKMISHAVDLLVLTLPDGRSMSFRQVNQFSGSYASFYSQTNLVIYLRTEPQGSGTAHGSLNWF